MAAELNFSSSVLQWRGLILELRRRGARRRESGAFLLGDASRRIRRVAYYDDLDPKALKSGLINLSGDGLSRLWEICADTGLKVVSDIHTHPDDSVGQSMLDQRNPMMARKGHIGIIVPRYAHFSWWQMGRIGVYVYDGNLRWSGCRGDAAECPLEIKFL